METELIYYNFYNKKLLQNNFFGIHNLLDCQCGLLNHFNYKIDTSFFFLIKNFIKSKQFSLGTFFSSANLLRSL